MKCHKREGACRVSEVRSTTHRDRPLRGGAVLIAALAALLLLLAATVQAHEVRAQFLDEDLESIVSQDRMVLDIASPTRRVGAIEVTDQGGCTAVMEVEIADPIASVIPVTGVLVGVSGTFIIDAFAVGTSTITVRWAGNAPPDCTEVGQQTLQLVVIDSRAGTTTVGEGPGETPPEGSTGAGGPTPEPTAAPGLFGSYWADFPGLAYTFISVTNVGSASETVTVTFFDQGGTEIGSTASPVAPGATWRLSTAGGGGAPETGGMTGSLRIIGSSGEPDNLLPWSAIFFPDSTSGFTGSWVSRGGTIEQSASGAGAPAPIPRWTSSFIADFPGLAYTFISVTNTSAASHSVTVTFYDDSGIELSSVSNTVAVNATWALATAGGGGPPATAGMTGHLEVTSDSGDSSDLLPWAAIFFPATTSGFTATWSSR